MAEVDSGLEQISQLCLCHVVILLFRVWVKRPAPLAGDLVVARQDPASPERGLDFVQQL
jgi:hypothetical protein